jgi:death-on-curing protein
MYQITLEQIIHLQKRLIDRFGGTHGVRDIVLIESAISRPFHTFDGVELYPDNINKISAITFGLIKNHGFIDGNKRIGVAVLLFLSAKSNLKLKYSDKEMIELGEGIASSLINENDLNSWIKEHQV